MLPALSTCMSSHSREFGQDPNTQDWLMSLKWILRKWSLARHDGSACDLSSQEAEVGR